MEPQSTLVSIMACKHRCRLRFHGCFGPGVSPTNSSSPARMLRAVRKCSRSLLSPISQTAHSPYALSKLWYIDLQKINDRIKKQLASLNVALLQSILVLLDNRSLGVRDLIDYAINRLSSTNRFSIAEGKCPID